MKRFLVLFFAIPAILCCKPCTVDNDTGLYLTAEDVASSIKLLPPPPQPGSAEFALDEYAHFQAKLLRDTPRGKLAIEDAVMEPYSLVRWKESFGLEITQETMPATYRLLVRSQECFGTLGCFDAKDYYHRTRPFVYYGEQSLTYWKDEWLKKNFSYPSGHSANYYGLACILSALNPARQIEIFQRAEEGAYSRVIAGCHWLSDTRASRLVALAVFARLQSCPEYLADFKRAKKEVDRLLKEKEAGRIYYGNQAQGPGWIFPGKGPYQLDAKVNVAGDVCVAVVTDVSLRAESQDTVLVQSVSIGADSVLHISLGKLQPGFYQVRPGKGKPFNIGVRPEKVKSPADAQADFDAFWAETISQLDTIPFDAQYTLLPEHSDSVRECFKVSFRSFGGGITGGILTVPVKPGKYPVWIKQIGYGAKPEYEDPSAHPDRIYFHVSVRGQGVFEEPEREWITRGLGSKETFYYRGAFADVKRAIDFAASLDKADPDRMVVYGESQGGGLSFIAAALDPRIKAVAAGVPFLGDWPDYARIARWPMKKVLDAADKQGVSREDLFTMLSYFDAKNFAHLIKCPVFMGFGLQDRTCPPHINFATYNNLKVKEKHWLGIAKCDHHIWEQEAWISQRDSFLEEAIAKR